MTQIIRDLFTHSAFRYSKFLYVVATYLPLVLTNCTSGGKIFTLPIEEIEKHKTVQEVIVFVGNPGVGKSSLINSIIQRPVFKSGASGYTGLTRQEQSYAHENKLYIDTPGIDDIELRQQAAVEIEKALKHGNKYKIVFVATVEGGRFRPADIVAINTVCAAIKTDFEYGLIINKTTKEAIKKMGEAQGLIKFFKGQLCKQPSSILTLKFEGRMYDKENKYFSEQSRNKEELANFVNQLTAKDIKQEDVVKLDIRNFEEKVAALETAHKEEIAAIKKQLQVSEEERKLEEERHKAGEEQYRADQARLKEKLARLEERLKKQREETDKRFNGQIHELKTGGTPLHTAAWQGDLEALKMLLQARANINLGDNEGMTPLHWTASEGQLEALKLLLQARADINLFNKKFHFTPLHVAATHDQVEAVKTLLQANADINGADDGMAGGTPLYWAAGGGQVKMVKTLLDAKAGLNVASRGWFSLKRTPLHEAADCGHEKVVQVLLDAKANPNVVDRHGQTPLSHAASRGDIESVQALLQAKADVTLYDERIVCDKGIAQALAKAHRGPISDGCKIQ